MKNEQSKRGKNGRKLRRLPVYMTNAEVERLLSVIGDPRNRFLLSLMYYLGLRVSEALGVRKPDFLLKEGYLIVRADCAKRGKERHVPVPGVFKEQCKSYLCLVGDDARLFTMSRCRVWQLVRQCAAVAKIDKDVHPHTLRHSYASHVLGKTNNLALVQQLLGHENIATTQIYCHLSDAVKVKAIEGVFYFAYPTNDLSSQANFERDYWGCKGPSYPGRPMEVGLYLPNKLGLYNMHGNVWEWCADPYDGNDREGYTEPDIYLHRLLRGGSWRDPGSNCRAASRAHSAPDNRANLIGFRLARVPSGR